MTNHVAEADRLQYISDIPIQELAERAANEGVSLLDYFAIVRHPDDTVSALRQR